MSPKDQANAAAFLNRWFEAYSRGELVLRPGASTLMARELSALNAGTRAFLTNQNAAPYCAACGIDHKLGEHLARRASG